MASDRIWLRKVLASDPQLARQVASPLVAYRWARSGPVSPKMTAKAARAVAATTIEARNWRQVSHIIGFPPLRSGGRGLAHIGQCEIFEVRLHPRLLAVRGEQFADLAREPHVRGGQHDQVVADTFQIGDQVRGQHHGHAVFGHGAGQVPQEVSARQGVEAGHRLIEDQQLRPLGDGQGQGQLGALAAGQPPGFHGRVKTQPPDPVRGQLRVPAMVEMGAEPQVVGDGEHGVGGRVLGDEPDPGQLRGTGRRLAADHLDRPRGRGQQAGDQVQQRRLPGPGRADDHTSRAWMTWSTPAKSDPGTTRPAALASYRRDMNPLLKGLRERHWIAIDVACTVLLVLVYGVEFNLPADLTSVPRGVAALVAATAVLPAAVQRRSRWWFWPGP